MGKRKRTTGHELRRLRRTTKDNGNEMILSIYCSELSVDDEPPKEHTDENGFVFVRGMQAINSKGAILFSVSGSDELYGWRFI